MQTHRAHPVLFRDVAIFRCPQKSRFSLECGTAAWYENLSPLVRTSYRAPNINAYIERWLQSLQVECLDHFIVFGEDHFGYLIAEYVAHYNKNQPHQSLDNLPINGRSLPPPPDWKPNQLDCTETLGGVLKTYAWKTAA